jgi:ribosome-associated protein
MHSSARFVFKRTGREVTHGNRACDNATRLDSVSNLQSGHLPQGGNLATLLATDRNSTLERKLPSALERACIAARTARDLKGKDISVLDMRAITPHYDFMVLITGTSRRQLHALAEEIDAQFRAIGDDRIGIEGYEASKWIVQDYSDVIVHVFDPESREFYSHEEMWADAPKIDWEGELLEMN